jgi:hypothetical protein
MVERDPAPAVKIEAIRRGVSALVVEGMARGVGDRDEIAGAMGTVGADS